MLSIWRPYISEILSIRAGAKRREVMMVPMLSLNRRIVFLTAALLFATSDPSSRGAAPPVNAMPVQRLWATTSAVVKGTLGLAFSPDGQRLAVGGRDGVVRVADVSSWRIIREFRGQDNPARHLMF